QAGRRDPPRAERGAQEPAPGRREPGVLHQGGEHRPDADPGGAVRHRRRADSPPPREGRMNPRIAIALVALLVVVGSGALYYQYQERAQKADNVGALGRPLLKDLKLAE